MTTQNSEKIIHEEEKSPELKYDIHDVLAVLTGPKHRDFWAQTATLLNKSPSIIPPVMAVRWNKGYILEYNPFWLNKQIELGDQGLLNISLVIAHECFHIISNHIPRQLKLLKSYKTRRPDIPPKEFLEISAITTDYVTNEEVLPFYIKKEEDTTELVKGMVTKANFPYFPEKVTYEILTDFYIQHVRDKQETLEIPMPKCFSIEDLLKMAGELSDSEMDQLCHAMQEQIRDLKEQMKKFKAWGNIPHWLSQELDKDLEFNQKIPWLKMFVNWVASQRSASPVRSFTYPNRKNMMIGAAPFPGKRRKPTYSLMILGDESGSMCNQTVSKCLHELLRMQRDQPDIKLSYLPFDAGVGEIREIDSQFGTANLDELFVRNLCGGTDFNPPMKVARDRAHRSEIDAVIVFTDGFGSDVLQENIPSVPILWVITESDANPNPGLGQKIYVD